MRYLKQLQTLALLAVLPVLSHAADDVKGSKDHPMFTRMPGASIISYEESEFNAHKFLIKPAAVTVEGRSFKIVYGIARGAYKYSSLQVIRNYTSAIQKIGGEVVYESADSKMAVMKLAKDGSEVWASVRALNNPVGQVILEIVEKAGMAQVIQASDMLDALNKQGYIALDIHFDTGKAVILPESRPVVSQISALLKGNPRLNISVEGHTDNVGKPADNKVLSGARAKAVMTAILAEGVGAARLSAVGHGQDRPVADNRTEEGRAKNRRVELVKK